MADDTLPQEIIEKVERADITANISKSTLLLSEIVLEKLQKSKNWDYKVPTQDINMLGVMTDIFIGMGLNE